MLVSSWSAVTTLVTIALGLLAATWDVSETSGERVD